MSPTLHQIEPELLQPKPRPVRAKRGAGAAGFCGLQLFLVPFILVGLGTFAGAIYSTSVIVAGRTVPGRITKRFYQYGSKGSGGYRVRYTYTVDGRIYNGLDQDHGEVELRAGMAIPVRIAPWAPNVGSRIAPPGVNLWSGSSFLWLFTIFWNAIVSVFVYIFFVLPRAYRRLYSHGDTAIGTILGKTAAAPSSSTGSQYRLTYSFIPARTGHAATSSQEESDTVSWADGDSVQPGDAVTILYNPAKPGFSAIYRFGMYEVLDRQQS